MEKTINVKDASFEQLAAIEAGFIRQYGGSGHTNDLASKLYIIHEELAKKKFPDLDYQDYLTDKHENKPVQKYLEIGVRWGDALALATADCEAIAVDPEPAIRRPIRADHTIHSVTSDDFFFEYSGQFAKSFDMVFVDGLHVAKQATKDIFNAFSVLAEGGEILVHDVMPIAMSIATPEQNTRFWTGDVWKAAGAFCVEGAPYKFEFVPAFPTGLFRIYDVDPSFVPDAHAVMNNLRKMERQRFPNAQTLLKYLNALGALGEN